MTNPRPEITYKNVPYVNLSEGFLLLHWFFKWKMLPYFPKHKINESNLIANYYSLRCWRDQSLKVIFGAAASGFCPFFLQVYSLITTCAFIAVMSTKLHLLHRHKKMFSINQKKPIYEVVIMGLFIKEHLSLEVILFLTSNSLLHLRKRSYKNMPYILVILLMHLVSHNCCIYCTNVFVISYSVMMAAGSWQHTEVLLMQCSPLSEQGV